MSYECKRKPVTINGNVYPNIKTGFEAENKVAGQNYLGFMKRVGRLVKKGYGNEEAMNLALRIPKVGTPIPVTYKRVKYPSLSALFNSIDPIEKDEELTLGRFISRYSEIEIDRPELTQEEVIFVALNAKKYQSTMLKLSQYKIQELLRKEASEDEIAQVVNEYYNNK